MRPRREVALQISQLLHLGGMERSTLSLARALMARGHGVTLLTSGPIHPSCQKLPILSLCPAIKPRTARMLYFDHLCRKWLQAHRPAAVLGMERNSFQTHYRTANGVHRAWLELGNKGLLSKLFPYHRLLLRRERELYTSSCLIFANSELVANQIQEHYDTPKQRIRTIYNGVDQRAFGNAFAKRRAGKELRLLFVGNDYARKGLDVLLRALVPHKKASLSLSVVGRDQREPLFRRRAKSLEVDHLIQWHGATSTAIPFYQKSDCSILPTLYDPCANTTLEALSMGLYTITSRFDGASAFIKEENGAILQNPQDPAPLVEIIQTLLERRRDPHAIRTSVQHVDRRVQEQLLVEALTE